MADSIQDALAGISTTKDSTTFVLINGKWYTIKVRNGSVGITQGQNPGY